MGLYIFERLMKTPRIYHRRAGKSIPNTANSTKRCITEIWDFNLSVFGPNIAQHQRYISVSTPDLLVTRRLLTTLLYMKPTPAPHDPTGAPPRAIPRRAHLVRTTSRSDPQSHNISLTSVPHHLIGRFDFHQGFPPKHLCRPSMV